MGAKYTHTNINSPDWRRLSAFYQKVFGCVPVPPLRDLHGDFFEKVTGVKGAHVTGEHIMLPGYGDNGPTFEIFTYTDPKGDGPAGINEYGFAHVAFEVDDVEETFTKYYETKDMTLTFVYAKDPDGNNIEVQKWYQGNRE